MGDPDDEGGVDWRRFASDRNVSHAVARGLWEHARATAPHDPVQAERAFHNLLDQAAVGNATHEPGRETLVDARDVRDAGSLGPGKLTRVLDEQKPSPKQNATGAKSAEGLRNDLLAAVAASKAAVELLAHSDPATIIEALRGLREHEGGAMLDKIMGMAGGTIERMLDAKMRGAATAQSSATPPATATATATAAAPAGANANAKPNAKAATAAARDLDPLPKPRGPASRRR